MNVFEFLTDKDIIAILDGDIKFGTINGIDISMPYLSGQKLCVISTNFGLQENYQGKETIRKSRWEYLSNLIMHCISQNKISDLLNYLFKKANFQNKLFGLTPREIEVTYDTIIKTVMDKINGILYFKEVELLMLSNNQFVMQKKNSKIEIAAPQIKQIDCEYIKTLSKQALSDIENNNFDSAITKCRTLLEEVFCYVIEQKNENPNETGDITKLYSQVKNLYSMHQDKTIDNRVNDLLSGLNKIIDSISQMRNKSSDSHGVGKKRISIADYHARLYVNASIITAEFILSVATQNWKDTQ